MYFYAYIHTIICFVLFGIAADSTMIYTDYTYIFPREVQLLLYVLGYFRTHVQLLMVGACIIQKVRTSLIVRTRASWDTGTSLIIRTRLVLEATIYNCERTYKCNSKAGTITYCAYTCFFFRQVQ